MASEKKFTEIVSLLTRAHEAGLKYPKIRLQTDSRAGLSGECVKVALNLAGAKARFPGSVNVTDGGPYSSSTWYGRIHVDGTWECSRRSGPVYNGCEVMRSVYALLVAFDKAPAEVGALQGALTGTCCFCGRYLEMRESVGVGYGPVCAERYGLPWGDTDEYKAKKQQVIRATLRAPTTAKELEQAESRNHRLVDRCTECGENLVDVAGTCCVPCWDHAQQATRFVQQDWTRSQQYGALGHSRS